VGNRVWGLRGGIPNAVVGALSESARVTFMGGKIPQKVETVLISFLSQHRNDVKSLPENKVTVLIDLLAKNLHDFYHGKISQKDIQNKLAHSLQTVLTSSKKPSFNRTQINDNLKKILTSSQIQMWNRRVPKNIDDAQLQKMLEELAALRGKHPVNNIPDQAVSDVLSRFGFPPKDGDPKLPKTCSLDPIGPKTKLWEVTRYERAPLLTTKLIRQSVPI
jgi:hypothetical protein